MLDKINNKINSDKPVRQKKDNTMAKCQVCGKSVQFGCNVSHSHKKTNKMWRPNVKKIKVRENNYVVRKHVCTRCIRSGKVVKAI